jgi:exonuclease III
MKILTWNCNGALRKKFIHLEQFDADIIIIQECENPELSKDKKYKDWAKNYLWTGENNSKGLGIFAAKEIKIENLNWKTDGLKYFIACKVDNGFNLLGTWCHGANSPTFGYIGQLWKYLQIHKANLGKCIIAGDFNSNVIWDRWDRWWNHSDVVRELRELKIESLYHKHNAGEEEGKELQPTFYLQKNLAKPYHIDYVFASDNFKASLKVLTIGNPDEWIKISDHMPVFCEV